ncbi:NAD(P)-dependent oxidoreductase [Nocardia terpenica]|uniref:NAD(P)-dependent oxidoreductase n=1 Tax=Nocardia terpenica TaxID=455432 RepID=UPI002B4B7C12|nr:NAD(P)H-binding protein [Nocardia terpenica]
MPYGKEPIATYSDGVAAIVAAMRRHRVRRLVAVSSSALDPRPYPDAGFLFNRVLRPYVVKVLGRTTYDDMRRMERAIVASEVDWTIVRPGGLYDLPEATDYTLVEGRAEGRFTARADLAASLLRLLDDDRFVHRTVGVMTTVANPTVLQLIRREAFAKR